MEFIRKSWEEICKIKDEKQNEALDIWIRNGATGSCEWFTGAGKTTLGNKAIGRAVSKNENVCVHVVVPTSDLEDQWNEKISNKKNVQVFIINSYIKEIRNCDFLILDEIHLFAAPSFNKVFTLCKYKWILGLTGTFNRKDGKQTTTSKYCPIVHRFPLEEGINLGIVARHQYFNIYVNLSPDEQVEYDSINQHFDRLFTYFDRDMNIMHSCIQYIHAENRYNENIVDIRDEDGNILHGKTAINKLRTYAVLCNKYMQKREQFVQDNFSKKNTVLALLNRLDLKTIIFNESNSVANELAHLINITKNKQIANSYHSDNTDKQNKSIFRDFVNNLIKILVSTRKLITGIDITDLEMAIALSYNSSETDSKQSLGRLLRIDKYNLDKFAIYINIITKNTIEEKWSKYRQNGIKRIINVNSVEDLITKYNLIKNAI